MKNDYAKYEKKQRILVIMFYAIITVLVMLKSSSNPFVGWDYGKDSAVFKMIATMMNNGYMPWKDSFDHKGPLMYAINYLGYLLSPKSGIWFIEVLFMFVTFVVMHMIARLKTGRLLSIVSTLVSASLLFDFLGDGNYTEEYALPFILIGLYIFIDYMLNERVNRVRLIVCGGCMGCVLLLRPNMIAVWMVFCIVIFGKNLFSKEKRNKLGEFVLFFSIGLVFAVLPFALWLMITGTFNDCWQSYILFNKEYISNMAGANINRERYVAFMCFLKHVVEIIVLLACFYLMIFREHLVYLASILSLVISLLFISMSGMQYEHYGLTLIPCLVFPLAGAFEECRRLFKWKFAIGNIIRINIMVSLMAVFLVGITVSKWMQLSNRVNFIYQNFGMDMYSDDVNTVVSLVDENTEEDDRISVYGNWDIIYLVSNRLHSTRYSYQFPIGNVSKGVLDEYFEQLQYDIPGVIVVEKEHMDDRMMNYLTSNKYEIIWEGSSDDERNGAMVWKKFM